MIWSTSFKPQPYSHRIESSVCQFLASQQLGTPIWSHTNMILVNMGSLAPRMHPIQLKARRPTQLHALHQVQAGIRSLQESGQPF